MNDLIRRFEKIAKKNPSVAYMYQSYLSSHPTIDSERDLCAVLMNAVEILAIQDDLNQKFRKDVTDYSLPSIILQTDAAGIRALKEFAV